MIPLQLSITQTLGAFDLDVDFEMPHRVTGVFGRSGCGKTSLLRAIAGLSTPNTGYVRVAGQALFDQRDAINLPVHKRHVGTVFQDARLFPHLTVAQNLDFGARYAREPVKPADRSKIINVLDLGTLLDRSPARLSGGEQSRVALGRALLSGPRLLLLDEPLAALDWARKAEILPYLRSLVTETNTPMLYVSHDMDEIVQLAGGLAIMRAGQILACGTIADVLADPSIVPIIGPQDAGAILEGTVQDHSKDGLSQIDLRGGMVNVPRLDAPIGSKVRLRVRAQDVILSTRPPEGLSAQTVLKATITAVHKGQGPGVAVGLAIGSNRLLARITTRAMTDMGLQVGQTVWAILKATATPERAVSVA